MLDASPGDFAHHIGRYRVGPDGSRASTTTGRHPIKHNRTDLPADTESLWLPARTHLNAASSRAFVPQQPDLAASRSLGELLQCGLAVKLVIEPLNY